MAAVVPTQSKQQANPTRWGSLSLRLSAAFVAVLVTAAFSVGYLFDRGRAKAVEERAIEQLRLHTERGADEVARLIGQLQRDVLFLARTPPIQGIRRALNAGGNDAAGGSTLDQWIERLQQIFLSFGEARPEYFQLRFIGIQDDGREVVRVERADGTLRVTPPGELQPKGNRYYVREAARLPPGSVYLSRIDLNREHGQLSIPPLPTLRVATPVSDPAGNVVGLVVVNMDMGWVFDRAQSFRDGRESLYIANEHGEFLFHPESGRAFSGELGTPFRLADAFPGYADRIFATLSNGPGFLAVPGPRGDIAAFVTSRTWDPNDPNRRLTYLLTEPMADVFQDSGWLRRESLVGMGFLLALAVLLIVVMVRRITRSLTALASAAGAVAGGDYRIVLPTVTEGEVAQLVSAFQSMAGKVASREEALAALSNDLERRVEERTTELSRQHAVQQLILDNIADGVVVADGEGRFLLWNRKAEQIVGSGPDEVRPEQWSRQFGVFRDEGGEPVPAEELPLLRAIHGEPSDNVELYLHNPKRGMGRWAQVTARPMRNADGDVTGGVAVLVDVTEQKRLRRRLESHRAEIAKVGIMALGAEVAAAAAHQISQPIAAMSNYAGAALRLHQQGVLGEGELHDLLRRIESLAQQAGEILNKLRALIRRRDLPLVPVDVNRAADSCLEFLSERIQRQGVRVHRQYHPSLPKIIGDPIGLEHVLIQLVLNALDSMDGAALPERCLSIRTDHDAQTGLVAIEVADTGPGVSSTLTGSLFEPWQTNKPDALGIGLTIAQSLIEARNGRIRMDTKETGGARFRIELPVERGETT